MTYSLRTETAEAPRARAQKSLVVAIAASGAWLLSACGLVLDASPHNDAGRASPDAAADPIDAHQLASDDAYVPPGADASFPDAIVPEPDGGRPPLPDGAIDRDASSLIDAGPSCSAADLDADGWSECDGDCNDADDTIFPGARMRCGDGVINDCAIADPTSPVDEAECRGLYVATWGDDTAPGTPEAPLATINRAVERAASLPTTDRLIHVQSGDYMEDVITQNQVEVWGGFDDRWRHVPSEVLTKVHTTTATGVQVRADTMALRDLSISQDGTEVATHIAAVTIEATATVVLEHCTITVSDLVHASDTLVGIDLVRDAGPSFVDTNVVVAASAPTVVGVDGTDGARPYVRGLDVRAAGSTGTAVGQGTFGMRLTSGALTADHLSISVGSAMRVAVGLELSVLTTSLFAVQVDADPELPTVFGIRVNRTALQLERANVVLSTHTDAGVAMAISNPTGASRVVNSVFFAGSGPRQVALSLEGSMPAVGATLDVDNNVLDAGEGSDSLTIALDVTGMVTVTFGRFFNNVLLSRGVTAFGVRLGMASLVPLAFDHNAIDVGATSASHIAYGIGTAATSVPGLHGLLSGCGLPSAPGDYHLPSGSECIDRGAPPPEAPLLDFEGEVRDATPDIGADEFGGVLPTP